MTSSTRPTTRRAGPTSPPSHRYQGGRLTAVTADAPSQPRRVSFNDNGTTWLPATNNQETSFQPRRRQHLRYFIQYQSTDEDVTPSIDRFVSSTGGLPRLAHVGRGRRRHVRRESDIFPTNPSVLPPMTSPVAIRRRHPRRECVQRPRPRKRRRHGQHTHRRKGQAGPRSPNIDITYTMLTRSSTRRSRVGVPLTACTGTSLRVAPGDDVDHVNKAVIALRTRTATTRPSPGIEATPAR